MKYKSKYLCTLQNMKKENFKLRRQIKNLSSSAVLELENVNCISKVGNKIYSTQCRKAINACFEYQVPVNSVCPVITAIIKELANFTVDFLPEPSTICHWVYELGKIRDLQVEVMHRHKDITLLWGSTSVNGHVAHICDCIDNIARIFSMYHNLDYLH